jgi:DMSO/TMAO reductase YedYZ molybdopterin-dependent catalytic subunit
MKTKIWYFLFLSVALFFPGCNSANPGFSPISTATAVTAQESIQESYENMESCSLDPIIVPTLPAIIPGYTELDESTGLHVTGYAQTIDLETYRLEITGKVDHPLSLTYDQLRCMPRISASPDLICQGYFVDVATWTGVPLIYLLDLAGVQNEASEITLLSADGYRAYFSLDEAMQEGNFLAYEWEGQPLPILHGFPLRAVFPTQAGNKWVKWLVEIRVE